MKETKVYVDELPVNCDKCKYYTQFDNGMGCMIIQELRPMGEKENYIQPDCPLVDIKTHDRELVKEVCEKIREFCENNKYRCNKYFLLYSIGLNVKLINKNKEGQKETFYEFLDQIQKEFKV